MATELWKGAIVLNELPVDRASRYRRRTISQRIETLRDTTDYDGKWIRIAFLSTESLARRTRIISEARFTDFTFASRGRELWTKKN